jgi:hypothetical protein
MEMSIDDGVGLPKMTACPLSLGLAEISWYEPDLT